VAEGNGLASKLCYDVCPHKYCSKYELLATMPQSPRRDSAETEKVLDFTDSSVFSIFEFSITPKKKTIMLTWQDFEKVDMRTGTILEVNDFPKARQPAYQLRIDFGELGIKNSSAQITKLYQKSDLIGKQVVAVVNFPPKQIATFMSECLVLGVIGTDKEITLLHPERTVKNGLRIG
jgi:tRNA-binding protein